MHREGIKDKIMNQLLFKYHICNMYVLYLERGYLKKIGKGFSVLRFCLSIKGSNRVIG